MTPRVRRIAALAAVAVTAALLPAAVLGTASAATATPHFTALEGFRASGDRVRVAPAGYRASRLDLRGATADLQRAPLEGKAAAPLTFALPTPDGGSARFAVERTETMEAGLAAGHPEMATFSGRGLTDPRSTVAIDITPMGLHASVRGPVGQRAWYLDPAYNLRGTTTYLSYYGAAVPRGRADYVERDGRDTRRILATAPAKAADGAVIRRDFRLAMTSDPSYAAYFGTDNVLAEKVTLINRVNQIYNDDLAIRMRLVNATDDLNLDTEAKATGANGPCGAAPCFRPGVGDPTSEDYIPGNLDFCDVGTLGRNRTVLGQLVGAGNYDVGHIALGVNGGGIAYLGVTGIDYKGGGCTGLPFPQGDFFAIDYVAHELGHQFAGDHTFNGCGPGNRNGATSVEPGGGTSVMAYAGICGQDDLQPHSDPYFSQRTIDQMTAWDTSAGQRVTEVQTVSLRGFDLKGETITLGYGSKPKITLTRGTNYDAASIKAAVEKLTGAKVLIAGWGYDAYDTYDVGTVPLTKPDGTGFQVIFNTNRDPAAPGPQRAYDPLIVTSLTRGVSGFVGETAQGGPGQNQGQVQTTSSNHAPVVAAPSDKTIPVRTPFSLTGSAEDADGDSLTYLWEQNNIGADDRFDNQGNPTYYGGTDLVSNLKRNGPLFRVFGTAARISLENSLESPAPGLNQTDGSPTRVFPDLRQVLAGNTNAATGQCPAPPSNPNFTVPPRTVACYSEFLPRREYEGSFDSPTPRLDFRLTARDGYANGGGVGHDDVTLYLATDAGPFLVRSQARHGLVVRAGATGMVGWAVNGTNAPELAPRVRITLSDNGGRSFDHILARSTPNDGSQPVVWPQVSAANARIKVEAVGNYFFDVNDASFGITR